MRTFPLYKSRDADNYRVYAEETSAGTWQFTEVSAHQEPAVYTLSGDRADEQLREYRAMEAASFFAYYSGGRP